MHFRSDYEHDGLAATRHLVMTSHHSSPYMSPQLMQLTNTLMNRGGGRSKKQVCRDGHNDDTILPEGEVVFRAVSPHGHVYWEIDPKRQHEYNMPVAAAAAAAATASASDEDERNLQSQTTSSSDMSSRQSSSRYGL